METNTQQARESLQVISQAEAAARLNSPNNGTVPLVWGSVILVCMVSYDLVPPIFALAVTVAGAFAASRWSCSYQRCLPVKPLKVDKPRMFSVWGLYHGAVLMGGIALGTHFWHAPMRPGAFTLIGLLDAAPLLLIGWTQRRRAQGLHP